MLHEEVLTSCSGRITRRRVIGPGSGTTAKLTRYQHENVAGSIELYLHVAPSSEDAFVTLLGWVISGKAIRCPSTCASNL